MTNGRGKEMYDYLKAPLGVNLSQDENIDDLAQNQRIFYQKDNDDSVDSWSDAIDDSADYKRDLVKYLSEGVRTFIETFFPCGVTDTCDNQKETPSL